MAKAIMGFTITKPHLLNPLHPTKLYTNPSSRSLRQISSYRTFSGWHYLEGKRASSTKVNALPHWPLIDSLSNLPLMAVLVEQMDGTEFVTYKSVWHLSDRAIKNVYVFYIFFTCWGCLFFGSMKDPYYDSETYRKDGGDGTGHWVYEKQEDIEESARAELWREELIEEIEQKVGGLRELEEAGRK